MMCLELVALSALSLGLIPQKVPGSGAVAGVEEVERRLELVRAELAVEILERFTDMERKVDAQFSDDVSANRKFLQDMVDRYHQEVLKAAGETRVSLENRIANELQLHREYLQQLDDKFYVHVQYWTPVVVALFSLFLWLVSRTKKEAYEYVKNSAEQRAIAISEQKVREFIESEKPSHILKEELEKTLGRFKGIAEGLRDEVGRRMDELKQAKGFVSEEIQRVVEASLREQSGSDPEPGETLK